MKYPLPAYWRIAPVLNEPYDGDSFWAEVDRGDDDSSLWHVRLKDVFAPESKDPSGVECASVLVAWLVDHADGSRWPFRLETFRTPRSDTDVKTFARWVGIVTDAEGRSLNSHLFATIEANGWSHGIGWKS